MCSVLLYLLHISFTYPLQCFTYFRRINQEAKLIFTYKSQNFQWLIEVFASININNLAAFLHYVTNLLNPASIWNPTSCLHIHPDTSAYTFFAEAFQAVSHTVFSIGVLFFLFFFPLFILLSPSRSGFSLSFTTFQLFLFPHCTFFSVTGLTSLLIYDWWP